MCVYYVEILCADRIGVGCAHDVFIVTCHIFMHFSCIRTIPFLLIDINYVWYFCVCVCVCVCLSLSLSLSQLVCSWHLKRANILCPRTLSIPGHHFLPLLILPPLMSGSMMIKPVRTFMRTFHNEAFIRNVKSSYRTFSILTFPLSSTVRVGSHYVASRSLVPLWSYRSFTPTCMDSTIQYLILSLAFEVCAL